MYFPQAREQETGTLGKPLSAEAQRLGEGGGIVM